MKYVWAIGLLTEVIFLLKCGMPGQQQNSATIKESPEVKSTPWFFKGDSGYVCKGEILDFLQKEKITDTTPQKPYVGPWHFVSDADTIGKYYSISDTSVIVCVMNLSNDFETHVLLELRKRNNEIYLARKQEYLHGNYSCCWLNFDGFFKCGQFFGLKICGTGSGFCSTDYYFFKDSFERKENIGSYIHGGFESYDGDSLSQFEMIVTSKIKAFNDSVIFFGYDYTLRRKKGESVKVENKSCDVKYIYRNREFVTEDSLCLQKMHL